MMPKHSTLHLQQSTDLHERPRSDMTRGSRCATGLWARVPGGRHSCARAGSEEHPARSSRPPNRVDAPAHQCSQVSVDSDCCAPPSRHSPRRPLSPTACTAPPTKNPSIFRRIHSLGVGNVQEIGALRLELGVCGYLQVDALHLNQAALLQQQVLHHLEGSRGDAVGARPGAGGGGGTEGTPGAASHWKGGRRGPDCQLQASPGHSLPTGTAPHFTQPPRPQATLSTLSGTLHFHIRPRKNTGPRVPSKHLQHREQPAVTEDSAEGQRAGGSRGALALGTLRPSPHPPAALLAAMGPALWRRCGSAGLRMALGQPEC